jgi:CO/xanthine dehydrogenase FAD-binding subunit
MYLRPTTIEDALQARDAMGMALLAGGTDLYATADPRRLPQRAIDLTGIASLHQIQEKEDHWLLGATTTWADVINTSLPEYFAVLREAAREVGGKQVQHAGTLGGNLCNASPAADGVPALMAMGAEVVLRSIHAQRILSLQEFILAPRRTALAANEILTHLRIPKPQSVARSRVLKLGARRYLVISIVMVGVWVESEQGLVRNARVAVGACGPVATRLLELEAALINKPADSELGAFVQAHHLSSLQPIADVRADALYRLDAALTLVRRALSETNA